MCRENITRTQSFTLTRESSINSSVRDIPARRPAGVGAASARRAAAAARRGAAPTPTGTVTRGAARARARGGGTATTGSSCQQACVRSRS